jgi:integrase
MASLTRYSKGYKVRYRVYYPDGTDRLAFAYRGVKRDAEQVLGQASQLESITRQNALTLETATPFQHWRLLGDEDLQRWFPRRSGPLRYDRQALLDAYRTECTLHSTSQEVIRENTRRAGKFVDELGNVARLTEADLRAWQQALASRVSRKTVNLYLDTLRQLLDLCMRFGWREDNPARAVKKLPWKVSRLPQALTREQAREILERARALGAAPRASSVQRALYRLVVAGIFFELRRGELQYLLWSDTNGRQVWIQGKTLPDGAPWLPKDREARVIAYPGIARPIALVFGETPQPGFVFSPVADRSRRFDADVLTKGVRRLLAPIDSRLTLHSLRHTFATWRLMMGDPLLLVKGWMGHASAETLLRYAHIQPDPLQDLLTLLSVHDPPISYRS